jgi:type I restriction enzyme M protein
VKTVVLFFEKGAPTRETWVYQLDPGRSLGKTTALTDADFEDFVRLQVTRADSDKSWSVPTAGLDPATFDLSVKNPNRNDAVVHREPEEIIAEMMALDAESAEILQSIRGML